jgi:hypothetical protein
MVVVYRESDGGYDGLGGQARRAKKGRETKATRVSWLGAITEESTCSNLQNCGACACACWRQGCGYIWAIRSNSWGSRMHKAAR